GGDSPLQATSSSGATVSFEQGTSANGACTVSGSTVTFDHARDCTVTMSADGTDDYQALPDVNRTFSIGKGTQTISFTPPAGAAVGGDTPLQATSSSGATVSFEQGTSANGACTVSGSTVTFDHARDCTVTMSADGTDDYQALPDVNRTFSIGKGTQTISFTPPAGAAVGGDSPLQATSSSGATVSFEQGTSANGACTVSGSTVTFDHARDCT